MGLFETNIPVPDLGGRVEIKTTRRDSDSLVTLQVIPIETFKICLCNLAAAAVVLTDEKHFYSICHFTLLV